MAIFNGTKQLQDFVPWPNRGPNRPPVVRGKRVSKQVSRPDEIWRPQYATAIFKMTLAGMSPQKIAEALGIRWDIFDGWRKTKYEVQQAFAKGSAGVAGEAAVGLAMRAVGFSVPSEKVFYDRDAAVGTGKNKTVGKVIRVSTVEYYPPDPKAAEILLRQHTRGKGETGQSEPWAPPARVEHSGPNGQPLPIGGSVTFNTLMLLGSSPDDQQKAAVAYQQLLRASRGKT